MSEYSVFITDNDGHWYLIPEDQIQNFIRWVEWCEGDSFVRWKGLDFDNYRSNDPSMYRIKHLESR